MIRNETNCNLPLPMRLVIDGSRDRAFFEMRRHLRKKVAGNQLYLSFKFPGPKSAADRQAVHRIDVYPSEFGNPPQKIESFLKALFFVFVTLNDGRNFATGAMFRKGVG